MTGTGVFKGHAEVDVARISGAFDGDLVVRNQLEVHATGRVTGKVRYARLQVDPGGELNGDIAAGDKPPAEASLPPALN